MILFMLIPSAGLTERKAVVMTITDATPVAAVQHDTIVAGPNPHFVAVVKIMDETRCTERDAVGAILFIKDMLKQARVGARVGDVVGTHHLTTGQMRTRGYKIMDDIMPHGSTAVPGSAHALVEQILLGPDEYALVHDNPTGRPEDCSVSFSVRRVS
jgi:hypothetical protein